METFRYPGRSDDRITVFLHGFPGVNSKQNRVLAEIVARETGRAAEVFLYAGLGHAAGRFSFLDCRREVLVRIGELIKENPGRKIDLVGHSWGGYLALTIAGLHPERVSRLALLSPLLHFAIIPDMQKWFTDFVLANPTLQLAPMNVLADEFVHFAREWPAASLAEKISVDVDILLLQARTDETTPARYAQALVPHFRNGPLFELVETDHGFSHERASHGLKLARFLA